jgi:putative GTP pyrophosphokinase
MSMPTKLTVREKRLISDLVAVFEEHQDRLTTILDNLKNDVVGWKELKPHIHSVKWRIKDARHLRDKLARKIREAKKEGKEFTVTPQNFLLKINDLAGIRILHLHTFQIKAIKRQLSLMFKERKYQIKEGPTARIWDDESRAFFQELGISTKKSPSLYTSVHYVVRPNSKTTYTCEIQVRTLAEELWGEVDHTINYPARTQSASCREQIAVLARMTSSCSRLVDSIFYSSAESKARRRAAKRKPRVKAVRR